MGHERFGILPKTKLWIRIVDELMSSDLAEDKVKVVASQTIENVRDRLNKVEGDSGVIASFHHTKLSWQFGGIGTSSSLYIPTDYGFAGIDFACVGLAISYSEN
nr:hypothetical protein DMOBY_13580 [Dehalococcoides mccartyi]